MVVLDARNLGHTVIPENTYLDRNIIPEGKYFVLSSIHMDVANLIKQNITYHKYYQSQTY